MVGCGRAAHLAKGSDMLEFNAEELADIEMALGDALHLWSLSGRGDAPYSKRIEAIRGRILQNICGGRCSDWSIDDQRSAERYMSHVLGGHQLTDAEVLQGAALDDMRH